MKSGRGEAVAFELERLGVFGILKEIAEGGQLLEIKCEMPKCYCPKGRGHFDRKKHPPGPWAPTADHYPTLKKDGGRLNVGNVRLAHVFCNREDYGWRVRVTRLLSAGRSLQEIAVELNRKEVRAPNGSGKWSPSSVRNAFVS